MDEFITRQGGTVSVTLPIPLVAIPLFTSHMQDKHNIKQLSMQDLPFGGQSGSPQVILFNLVIIECYKWESIIVLSFSFRTPSQHYYMEKKFSTFFHICCHLRFFSAVYEAAN